jgi:hypothetical protein
MRRVPLLIIVWLLVLTETAPTACVQLMRIVQRVTTKLLARHVPLDFRLQIQTKSTFRALKSTSKHVRLINFFTSLQAVKLVEAPRKGTSASAPMAQGRRQVDQQRIKRWVSRCTKLTMSSAMVALPTRQKNV